MQRIAFLISLLVLSGYSSAQPRQSLTANSEINRFQIHDLGDSIVWVRPRPIPAKGIVQDFKRLFKAIHGDTYKVIFTRTDGLREIVFDTTTGRYYGHGEPRLMGDAQVIGWYPYWESDNYKNLSYRLLSTIAFFAYDIKPEDGTYTDALAIDSWNKTAMIDYAKENKSKVLLTLTSYGTQNNKLFLKNTNAWSRLGDSVKVLLKRRNADGVDLEYTGLDVSMKDEFTRFVFFLRTKLGDSSIMNLQILYDAVEVYDLEKLDPLINTFILKGFNSENLSCDNKPISFAPLFTRSPSCGSIESSTQYLLQHGISSKRIILSFPLYGAKWKYAKSHWTFLGNISYGDILVEYGPSQVRSIDELSRSTEIRPGGGENREVILFEGSESLHQKFQWGKNRGLGGVGLWGLGYDGNDPNIWDTVSFTFASPIQEIVPAAFDNGMLYHAVAGLRQYGKIVGVSLSIIINFFVVGLLLSFLDWRVRTAFSHNVLYRWILVGAIASAIAVSVHLFPGMEKLKGATFLYAFAVGVIVYIFGNIYLHYRKKMK